MNTDSSHSNFYHPEERPEGMAENTVQSFLEKRSALTEAVVLKSMQSFTRDKESFLYAPERDELKGVAGKTLLHLQCRSGLETLSWARLGARVVGVDFDPQAIARAKSLAQTNDLKAEFIGANIYTLPELLGESKTFDIVYTAYGVLFWLDDLPAWGKMIAQRLARDGVFYLVEYHPAANLLDERFDPDNPGSPRACYPYAHVRYQHHTEEFDRPLFEYRGAKIWNYTLSDVVQALVDAGLRITSLKEHPFMSERRFEQMQLNEAGNWEWNNPDYHVPLLFSLKATH